MVLEIEKERERGDPEGVDLPTPSTDGGFHVVIATKAIQLTVFLSTICSQLLATRERGEGG